LTEPNYLGLTLVFLGPALYFALTGLLLAPRRPRWNLVVLGLIPGIGLLACASDVRERVRKLLRLGSERWAARRASAARTPAPPVRVEPGQGAGEASCRRRLPAAAGAVAVSG
jgi:hypothetical protein